MSVKKSMHACKTLCKSSVYRLWPELTSKINLSNIKERIFQNMWSLSTDSQN
jgi:hypothetical protein